MKNIEHKINFDLKNLSTVRILSVADVVYFPKNTDELEMVLSNVESPIILGAGSNILFSTSGTKKPVICTKEVKNYKISGNKIEVEAGLSVQMLSKIALNNSLSGFEFLIGIPATVGGAVFMNAGCHGQEIKDVLKSAIVFDKTTGKTVELKNEDLKFSYRNSILKERPDDFVVLSATFELLQKENKEIHDKMQENIEFRKKVQPSLALPNLGSVFKNPNFIDEFEQKCSAGALIDRCSLKGYTIGGAQVYKNHANFVINFNNCTSFDYTNVVYKMYDKVREKFRVELSPEIIFAGGSNLIEEEKWKEMLKK